MTGYYAAQVVSSHSAFSASPRFTFISIFQPASRRYRGSETRPFAVPVLRRLTPRQSLPFCQVNACGSIALNRPTRSRTLNARKSCRLFDGSIEYFIFACLRFLEIADYANAFLSPTASLLVPASLTDWFRVFLHGRLGWRTATENSSSHCAHTRYFVPRQTRGTVLTEGIMHIGAGRRVTADFIAGPDPPLNNPPASLISLDHRSFRFYP